MRTWRVWAATVAIPCLSGCGTASNFYGRAPDARVYGGVRQDWASLQMVARDETAMSWPYAPLVAVDLPLSAVGDTLTLPYTLFLNSDLFKKTLIYEPPEGTWGRMDTLPAPSPPAGDR
jgi:uncharacterized protein YceK